MLVLCFLISFLSAIKISLVGELNVGECMLGALFFFQMHRVFAQLRNPPVRNTLILGLLYLASLMIADIYRQTLPSDYLRGWAKVGIMLFAFLNLAVLLGGRIPRLKAYLLGMMTAPLLSILVYGYTWDLYKFYVGFPISMLVFWFVGRSSEHGLKESARKVRGLVPFVAGIVALVLNSRALAGITLVAAIFNYLNSNQRLDDAKLQRRAIANTALMLCAALGVMQLYTIGAPLGWFGESARHKFEAQVGDQTEDFSVFTGRSEIFFAFPKIFSSPLIGYGSWAKDADYFVQRSAELGLKTNSEMIERGLIPTHSYLFGGWLEAGLLGGIFWAVMLWRAVRVLLLGRNQIYGPLLPLVNFMLIWFVWDVFFSPFGGERRLQNAFLLWLIVWPMIAEQLSKKSSFATPHEALRSRQRTRHTLLPPGIVSPRHPVTRGPQRGRI